MVTESRHSGACCFVSSHLHVPLVLAGVALGRAGIDLCTDPPCRLGCRYRQQQPTGIRRVPTGRGHLLPTYRLCLYPHPVPGYRTWRLAGSQQQCAPVGAGRSGVQRGGGEWHCHQYRPRTGPQENPSRTLAGQGDVGTGGLRAFFCGAQQRAPQKCGDTRRSRQLTHGGILLGVFTTHHDRQRAIRLAD